MKKYFIITVMLLLLLTNCRNQIEKSNRPDLPNDSLINEVILSVISIDSLDHDYGIVKQIAVPDIYATPKWEKDSSYPPPPPPPSSFGCLYEEIFTYFNSKNDPKTRLQDSVFIVNQIDTTLNHQIFFSVSKLFKNSTQSKYYFSLPVFSHDKKTVYILYNNVDRGGYMTVLRKVDGNWKKVDHRSMWAH